MREISRIELIHRRRRDRQLDLVPPNGRQMKLVDGDDLVSQPPREPTQPEATQHRADPHLDPYERQPALGVRARTTSEARVSRRPLRSTI